MNAKRWTVAIVVAFAMLLGVSSTVGQKPEVFTGKDPWMTAPELLTGAVDRMVPEGKNVTSPVLIYITTTIGIDGKTRDSHLKYSSNTVFNESALKQVAEYRYKPAMRLGKPVSVIVNLEVRFDPKK